MARLAFIGTVGDSNQPLVEHINEINPDSVSFIYTKRTGNYVPEIIEKCNIKNYSCIFLDNHQDIDEAFSKSLKEINNLLKEGYDVVGNFTPGTKTMSAGLAMACIEKNCEYRYGYGERDEKGQSTSFKENISQENPYEKRAINEFKRARNFFDKYQFPASLENFTIASSKLEDSHLKQRAEIFIKIVSFYDTWDKFNDESLALSLRNILSEIKYNSSLHDYFIDEFPNFYKQMKNNLFFLNKKDNSMYYLPDLLNNAQRRISEGKYDDAVARLYRALELIGQLQLSKFRIVDEETLNNEKIFQIDKNKLKKFPKNIIAEIDNLNLRGWKNQNEPYLKSIDLTKNYKLLNVISHQKRNELEESSQELYKFYNRINSHVKIRNKSILAHGLKPLSKKDAEKIYKLLLKHAKIICPNIEKEMEIAEFPLFSEE